MIRVSELQNVLNQLREKKPLVLSLTNSVTMDFMANCLLALGAAPIMTEAAEEVEELLTIVQALNLNIGTLNAVFLDRVILAGKIAKAINIPVILDPVGAGASILRTRAAQDLLPFADIIRGNSSEILALAQGTGGTKGVESSIAVDDALGAARLLAQQQKTVVISGEVDLVQDQESCSRLAFGSPLMSLITGMGCSLTAIISAFAGSGLSFYKAAMYGTAYFGLCGSLTAKKVSTPGSFKQVFIDTIYAPNWDEFQQHLRVKNE